MYRTLLSLLESMELRVYLRLILRLPDRCNSSYRRRIVFSKIASIFQFVNRSCSRRVHLDNFSYLFGYVSFLEH